MHLCFLVRLETQTCVTYHSRRFNAAKVELIGTFASHLFLPIRPYFIPRTLSDDRPVNASVALPLLPVGFVSPHLTGAIVTYEERLRWAAAMGFPVALLEALSPHSRHHSTYAARSPHQLLRSPLLQQWRARLSVAHRLQRPSLLSGRGSLVTPPLPGAIHHHDGKNF